MRTAAFASHHKHHAHERPQQVDAVSLSTLSAEWEGTRSNLPSPASEVRARAQGSLLICSLTARAPAVVALDISPVRLACAAHNARIYGVADRITFILADWVQWTREYVERLQRGDVKDEDKIEVVFLSPPWGGVDYLTAGSSNSNSHDTPSSRSAKKARRSLPSSTDSIPPTPTPALESSSPSAAAYPLSALAPLPGSDLFALARQCTRNVAFYLPRNVDLSELASLPGLDDGERIEIEEEWMGYKLKAVTAYFGELAVGNGWVQGDEAEE